MQRSAEECGPSTAPSMSQSTAPSMSQSTGPKVRRQLRHQVPCQAPPSAICAKWSAALADNWRISRRQTAPTGCGKAGWQLPNCAAHPRAKDRQKLPLSFASWCSEWLTETASEPYIGPLGRAAALARGSSAKPLTVYTVTEHPAMLMAMFASACRCAGLPAV